jgi:hypothetical protein
MLNYQELVQDTVMGLEVELFTVSSIVKVEVIQKGNWYNFQLTTNKEFLSDEEQDEIFELVLDANLDLRQRTGEKIYFRHSFIGVRKYYLEDQEFDSLSSAYEEAAKQLAESYES